MIEWISVKGRLPVEHQEYLVTDGVDILISWYGEQHAGWGIRFNFDRDDRLQGWSNGKEVSHWMPLPEPPQEQLP